MDYVLHSAAVAFGTLFTLTGMGFLLAGVLMGLVLGIIPGLGGIVGLSLLLPFTFNISPHHAMAILMGLAAAVSHGDVIPAILFGVPGTVGCAATVMDGYPMSRRGEAGRALGAAFNASLLGGLFGAIVLAFAIPVIRPVILLFRSPEMLAICIFGVTLVASLSGNAPLKGLTAAALGLLLSMIGNDPQTGTLRFTFGSLYLWDRLPVVPVALGIFAVPELCGLLIRRTAIAAEGSLNVVSGQLAGCKDAFTHWFLVLRTAALGAACAMIPGVGAPVIDWIAYGHAARTEKGASRTFGKGDVRGVIAAESSTNAREGGSLIPTIAFGVPANASMAILLGGFLIQGIVPGPDMLSKHLDVTYTIVWSLALANVFGTLICFAFANQFARIATIRYGVLLPIIMTLVYLGGFEGQHSWGDLIALLMLGVVGWVMKRTGWPRPPLVLGFILGSLIERYLFISVDRYGWSWLTNWFVLLMFGLAAFGAVQGVWNARRARAGGWILSFRAPRFSLASVFAALVLALFVGSLFPEMQWAFGARLMPQAISGAGIIFGTTLLMLELFGTRKAIPHPAGEGAVAAASHGPIAMDLDASYGGLDDRLVYGRAIGFFLWAFAVVGAAYLIGMLPALLLFLIAFMRFQARESWTITLIMSLATITLIWLIFDQVVNEPWPQAVIGDLFPGLRAAIAWF